MRNQSDPNFEQKNQIMRLGTSRRLVKEESNKLTHFPSFSLAIRFLFESGTLQTRVSISYYSNSNLGR